MSCPNCSICMGVTECRQAGGTCIASCDLGCCCQLPPGSVVFNNANHGSGQVNSPVNWSASLSASGQTVPSAMFWYEYADGPASSITVCLPNGCVTVNKGTKASYKLADCLEPDTRRVDITGYSQFPSAGSYTINMLAGYIDPNNNEVVTDRRTFYVGISEQPPPPSPSPSPSPCPPDTICMGVTECRQAGGTCVASCELGCCCQIPQQPPLPSPSPSPQPPLYAILLILGLAVAFGLIIALYIARR